MFVARCRMPTCTNMAVTIRHHSPPSSTLPALSAPQCISWSTCRAAEAHPMQHHRQKHRAVDAHQQIRRRSRGPRRPSPPDRRRCRRIAGIRRQNLRLGDWRITSHTANSNAFSLSTLRKHLPSDRAREQIAASACGCMHCILKPQLGRLRVVSWSLALAIAHPTRTSPSHHQPYH